MNHIVNVIPPLIPFSKVDVTLYVTIGIIIGIFIAVGFSEWRK